MRKDVLIKKLQKYFFNLKGVSLAFLFGSFSKGKEAFLSDIDVAVYLDDLNLEDKIWLELEQLAKRFGIRSFF
ncbi:MAG: nucleotidyltransferase domain-containing protein [Armatimonadetes bacterium]|nr:nucleotidyltransferase domain-containing protein [Armatimonadota bacterium]